MALSYLDAVLASGPSYYWRLGEPSGTSAVDSVGGANGTISGGVTLGVASALADGNTAMTFNGTTGKIVTAANVPRLTPFSIEAWVKTLASDERPVCFSPYFGGAEQWQVKVAVGATFYVVNQAQTLTTSGGGTRTLNDNQWHHIVFVFQSATVTIYTDGVLDNTHTTTFPLIGVSLPAEIGYGSNPSLFWLGSLDEVAIYPRALAANEILSHYAARLVAASTAPLDPTIMAASSFTYAQPVIPSDTVNLTGPRTVTDAIYIGGGGVVVGVFENDATAAFTCLAGQTLPVNLKRVNSTSTTATLLQALYTV